MFRRKTKAQAILEYIIVITALVLGFIAARTAVLTSAANMVRGATDKAKAAVKMINFMAADAPKR